MKIKVLKDTIFHKADTLLWFGEFRRIYIDASFAMITNEELINHLQTRDEKNLKTNLLFILSHFEINETFPDLPNDIIFEGLVLSKGFDGCYHSFPVGIEQKVENKISTHTIHEVETILRTCKFKKLVWYCTNNVILKF